MSRRPRRNHAASFRAKVALAALKGEKTLGGWRSNSMCMPTRGPRRALFAGRGGTRSHSRKSQLLEGAAGVFSGEASLSQLMQPSM
jgi:hypothetical protein